MFRLIIFLLIFPATCIASDNYKNIDCGKNQMNANLCAFREFNHYDKILNKLYQQQMHYLHSSNFKKYLRNAERAWIVYRDKDCTYYSGKPADSGTIYALEHNNCLTERTKSRIRVLKSYIACRDNGCPY